MQINNIGLYVKFAIEDIQTLLSLNEKIDVEIVDKLNNNEYVINIKGKQIKAYSTIDFQKKDKATLIVEKTKPFILLKLIEKDHNRFIPLKKLKIDIKNINIKLLTSQETQLNKNHKFQKDIKQLISSIKNAIDSSENILKTIKQEHNSMFIQIPVEINQTQKDTLFITKDTNNSKNNNKKHIHIVLYASPKTLGDIKIDMLYTQKQMHCLLSCYKEEGFDFLNKNKERLQKLLGDNISIDINRLKEKPIFLKKQIDLRI